MGYAARQLLPMVRYINRLRLKSAYNSSSCFRYFHESHVSKTCNLQRTSSYHSSLYTASLLQILHCGRSETVYLYSSGSSSEITDAAVKRAVDDISEKFSEAMELMNDARSSFGTVYFSEDVMDTQAQVEETLEDYKNLLSKLNEKQRRTVIQSIGLKMEELKAQMALIDDLAKE